YRWMASAASGAYVPDWNSVGVAFGLRISYQRTPTELPAVTLWLVTRLSWSPKLRYCSRYIMRSASESSCCVVPLWGMQVPPLQASAKAGTVISVGPEKVELAGVVQSTWNFHSARWVVSAPMPRTNSGSPDAGP